MRTSVFVGAVAAVLAAGAAFSSGAEAMTLNGAASLRGDVINPVETVACWRNGPRGWGWYRYCGYRGYGVGPRFGGGDRWRGHFHFGGKWHGGGRHGHAHRGGGRHHGGGHHGGGHHGGGHHGGHHR